MPTVRVKLGKDITHFPMSDGRKLVASEMPKGGFEVEGRDLHIRRSIACEDLIRLPDPPPPADDKPAAPAAAKGA